MVLSRLAAGSSGFSWRPCFSFFALYGKIQLMKRRNGGDEARGEFPNGGPDGSGTRSACGGTLVTGFFGIVYRRGHYRHAGWSRGPWDGGGASAFGARLDSAADLVFFTAAAIRLLPCLCPLLPPAVRLGTLAAAFLRGAVFTLCLLRLGCVPALHTCLNKLVGAGLFCLPYFIGGCLGWYAPVLCLLALLAAGKDLRLVCQGKSRAEECFQWRDFRWR